MSRDRSAATAGAAGLALPRGGVAGKRNRTSHLAPRRAPAAASATDSSAPAAQSPVAEPDGAGPAGPAAVLDPGWLDSAFRPDLTGGLPISAPSADGDADATDDREAPQPGAELAAPTGAGQPLPDALRADLERAFGADFSAVRVHEDHQATAIGAHSFASGTDLHFAPGRYAPHTPAGKELVAHELAHLLQQAEGAAPAAGDEVAGLTVVAHGGLEAEADQLAATAALERQADADATSAADATDRRPPGATRRAPRPSPPGARLAQRRVDRDVVEYFERAARLARGSQELLLLHVRRLAFEEKVNATSQTFQQVVTEVLQRASAHRDTVERDWQQFLAAFRLGDAERCQDLLWTLATFINQLYAVPGRLLAADDSRLGYQEKGELTSLDRMPMDYLQRGPKPLDQLGRVRDYAFAEPLNRRGQTLQEIVYEVSGRCPKHSATVLQLWQDFLDELEWQDPEGCGDKLFTLTHFVQQVLAVPQNLQPLTMAHARAAIPAWGKQLERSHGSGKTHVEAIDPEREVYDVHTLDLSAKLTAQAQSPILATDQDLARTESRSHVLFRDLTGSRFDFLFVALPRDATTATLQKLVRFRGKDYRLDLMGGSFVKSGHALAVEVGGTEVFQKLLAYEESVVYALRALFPQVVGGVKGAIRARTYPVDPDKDPTGKALTFTLRDGKTEIQLNDGWGYIKSSLADKMQEHELTRDKREPKPASGNANYQMMHWFDTIRPEVIHELTGHGLAQWQTLCDEAQRLQLALAGKPTDEERLTLQRALQDNLEQRYSVLTTGRPPLESAVAMPVSGSKVVLPSTQRFADVDGGGVSLLRSPADKPNWRPIDSDEVEHDSSRSKLLAGMEAIQYTATGLQDGALTFFKGMLGVLPAEQWPKAWDGVDLVVTGEDRKLYEKWHSEKERKQSRATSEDFTLQGNLVATQWFAPGSVVGVPNDAMKWLGGDYDGDEVNVLLESRAPALTEQISDEYEEDQLNPKLPKSFTNNPGGGRGQRLVDMRSPNVSLWSSNAAKLRALPPEQRATLATTLRPGNLLPAKELSGLDDEQAMWMEVGKGIKVGTDGFKTAVPVSDYERRASEYQAAINSANVYSLPYDKSLMKTIERAGPPTLTSPAWRNLYFSCTCPYDTGHAAPLCSVPAATLANMLFNLFPPNEVTQWALSYYWQLWIAEERPPLPPQQQPATNQHL